jgi:hypothetical protein
MGAAVGDLLEAVFSISHPYISYRGGSGVPAGLALREVTSTIYLVVCPCLVFKITTCRYHYKKIGFILIGVCMLIL